MVGGKPHSRPVHWRGQKPEGATEGDNRVVVENVNVPGYTVRLDGTMYSAMRAVMLKVLPRRDPGPAQSEIRRAVLPHLPSRLFPGGAKAVKAWPVPAS
jgi:hypothetical protein